MTDEKEKVVVEKDWEHCGLRCIALALHSVGHRCGYVGVPKAHPLYGVSYSEHETSFEVHGGLTYSSDGEGGYPTESDGVWWFGFDCGHAGDAKDPNLMDDSTKDNICRIFSEGFDVGRGVVRTLEYVIPECQSLAAQLHAITCKEGLI